MYSQEENRSKHEKGLAVMKFGESLSEKYVTEKKEEEEGALGVSNLKLIDVIFKK